MATAMEIMDRTYRMSRDRAIRRKRCTFIFQVRIVAALIEDISSGRWNFPDTVRGSLISFLNDDSKSKCNGRGLKCKFRDPHGGVDRLRLRLQGNNCMLKGNWKLMIRRCNLKESSCISMWGYYKDNLPRFIFRFDGYAAENQRRPPLTDMNVVDHETVQYKEKKEGCLDDCRCSVG